LLSKLKEGVFERSRQMKKLVEFIELSPHPIICLGDFNEMPYSYTYQYLRKRLKNTFEESGSGFGFTYHGGTLKVLRIDNQFYSSPIVSTDLTTRYDVELSDHFPVQATYVLSSGRP
jgi:endonuclease/exonuclease/phosphatase family metal-dependent hydrolase